MAKLIISGDFCTIATPDITSRTEAGGSYVDWHTIDYWHLKRRFRADDKNTNDWLLKFHWATATAVVGLVLNDVNFDKVAIQGNNADAAWGTPTYDGADLDISRDEVVDRHKIYIPLTGFTHNYLRIFIPTGTSATGDYQTKWEVGSVVPIHSITELSRNMSFGYQRSTEKPYEDLPLSHGGFERVSLGDELPWVGDVRFGRRTVTEELELWAINNYDIASPLVLYENRDNTSKVYLCLRDDSYQSVLVTNTSVVGNTIRFKELI